MPQFVVIAIDGPSGSGKSSVSREVARRLGLAYLDTGAMYRAATWWCLRSEIDLADADAVAQAVRAMPIAQGVDPTVEQLAVDGADVRADIRETWISERVSAVATNLEVREELRRLQRDAIAAQASPDAFSAGRGIVAEGRDITTVVAPDADVRILLTASEEARLARRATELHGEAGADAIEATRDQVLRRDRDDSTVVEFQVAADGVVTVDSSDLDFEQTIEAVLDVVARLTGTRPAA
ncbi:(d)CMP kinase [Sanguibacter sp. A247]|uniref:(d)CMP kinase n=1 Tax=unclassified Sanguibacter TaxID=2645534 RepID=UPI003FD81F66